MLPLIPLAISLVPTIGRWLFGKGSEPVIQNVADAIQQVTGSDPSTQAGVAAAQAAIDAKPELKLQLQGVLAAIETDAADVADARKQTLALVAAHSRMSWAPAIVSVVVLCGFIATLIAALTKSIPPGNETMINMVIGTLTMMAGSVVTYWVGSSSGSAQKTALLYASQPATPQPNGRTPPNA